MMKRTRDGNCMVYCLSLLGCSRAVNLDELVVVSLDYTELLRLVEWWFV